MLARERQDIIVRLVHERGSVTTQELMAMLGASESTIRRDLEILDELEAKEAEQAAAAEGEEEAAAESGETEAAAE